jgi:hypothetical protein
MIRGSAATPRTLAVRLAAALSVAAPLALYIWAGALQGFFAADEFQGLTTARDRPWVDVFALGERSHFYRPVASLWFVGAVRMCGDASPCYHGLQLALHGVVGGLLFALARYVSSNSLFATLTTATFLVMPGYVEAVMWISSATEVLSLLFLLGSTRLALQTADSGGFGGWWWAAAAWLGAMFAHESAVVGVPLIAALLAMTGRLPRVPWHAAVPFLAAGVLFVCATWLANRNNPVLTGGDYVLGGHMARAALDYVASLSVGPHNVRGYAVSVTVLVAIALAGPHLARLGLVWMLLTLLPFLGFTTGIASRYQYAAAVGFAWIVAAVLAAAHARWAGPGRNPAARITVLVCSAFIVARFAAFTVKAIDDRLTWFEAHRRYAAEFQASHRVEPGEEIRAPMPDSAHVRPEYVEPMLRWVLAMPDLKVQIENPR